MKPGRGNIAIDKTHAKRIENGKIVKDLPLIRYKGKLVPLFSVISPTMCPVCGAKLHKNKDHDRHPIASHGILKIPVKYWECSTCNNHCADEIVDIDGGDNYTVEYMDMQYQTRYGGKCSLPNNRRVGEIYTSEVDCPGRAACPATLWKYEQKRGKISLEELRNTEVPFNGTLYIDGYWVKNGWRKFVQKELGRELTKKEWKKYRYKVIYVVSTEDFVVLDFVITDRNPPYFLLVSMLERLKIRFGEDNIKKVVSDGDFAIIDAVKAVLPKATRGLCVFHQLKNFAERFGEHFKMELSKLPKWASQLYTMGKELIDSKSVIEATVKWQEINETITNSTAKGSRKKFESSIWKFLKNKFDVNVKYLKKGFVPVTNNVMEQLFSLWSDLFFQARSFKTQSGLSNFTANMYCASNNRKFNSGKRRGYSPIEAAHLKPG